MGQHKGVNSAMESAIVMKSEQAYRLEEYIRSLPEFTIVESMDGNYGHMGATLADAVLQAGLSYESTVKPRVISILKKYPESSTTSAFLQVLNDQADAIVSLANLFVQQKVETEGDLKKWLQAPENQSRLQTIKGIKEKTVDYLQLLVGIQTVAIDTHMYKFLAEAGLPTNVYQDAHLWVSQAAELLGHNKAILDYSIWKHMSNKPRKKLSLLRHKA
jgi:hypothetical protein